MLKLLKVVGSLLVFVLIALLAIPFFVDVNDYKPEIKKAVKDATGRNLDIKHIELSLFPWVGIKLNQVQLENAPEFEQPYMASIKSIDIQVELMPLFNQKIEIKRFELNTPQIWLTQKTDGSNNWSDFQQPTTDTNSPQSGSTASPPPSNTAKTKASKQDTSNSELPITFNAKLLKLTHGQILWNDFTTGSIKVSDIELKITDLQLQKPIGIDLSAKLGSDTIHIHAKVGPVLDLNTVDISKLPALVQIKTNNFSLAPFKPWLPELNTEQAQPFGALENTRMTTDISIEQHADTVILSSGSLQLKNKKTIATSWKLNSKALKTVHVQSFKIGIDDMDILTMTGKVRGLPDKPRFEARIETSKLQRIWLNGFAPTLQELYQAHENPWQSIKLATFIAGDTDILEIRNLQLELDNEPVQISGDVALGSAPDIQLRITTNELHLDPWIPQSPQETSMEGERPTATTSPNGQQSTTASLIEDTASKPEVEPDLTFLKPWYLSVQLNAKHIYAMNLQLDNLRMTLSSEKGVVRLNPLSFEIGKGHISENFTLYANRYPATWKESMKMNGVAVQPILKALADFDKLSGIAQLTTEFTGRGLLPKSITHSLKGRGNFMFKDGQFKGVDIAKAVRKLQKSKTTNQNSTDFAQMQGSFHIKNAVLANNDLYMASPLFRLTGKGKLYLDPLSLDYHVRPKLVQTLAGQGGSMSRKGVVVPLHIQGPFDNLDISPEIDKKSLLESAAALNDAAGHKIGGVGGQILDQGFVQTREEQKKKAAEKLKQKLAAEKERARKKAEQKTKDKLKDALKGFKF